MFGSGFSVANLLGHGGPTTSKEPPVSSPAYLTVAQAALRACVSESLLYEACKKKRIPHYRPGVNGRGKILLLPEDVDQWMAAFKVTVPAASDGAGDPEDEDEGLTYLR
jgi:excisionase family DNA binding protein